MKKIMFLLLFVFFSFSMTEMANAYSFGKSSGNKCSWEKSKWEKPNCDKFGLWGKSKGGDFFGNKPSCNDWLKGKFSCNKPPKDKGSWGFPKSGKGSCWQPPRPQCSPVPEPASMILLGSGLVGLAGLKKKLMKK